MSQNKQENITEVTLDNFDNFSVFQRPKEDLKVIKLINTLLSVVSLVFGIAIAFVDPTVASAIFFGHGNEQVAFYYGIGIMVYSIITLFIFEFPKLKIYDGASKRFAPIFVHFLLHTTRFLYPPQERALFFACVVAGMFLLMYKIEYKR